MTPPQQATVTFDIAVLPGDGIGVDVTREAVRVLEALSFGEVKFAFHESVSYTHLTLPTNREV